MTPSVAARALLKRPYTFSGLLINVRSVTDRYRSRLATPSPPGTTRRLLAPWIRFGGATLTFYRVALRVTGVHHGKAPFLARFRGRARVSPDGQNPPWRGYTLALRGAATRFSGSDYRLTRGSRLFIDARLSLGQP